MEILKRKTDLRNKALNSLRTNCHMIHAVYGSKSIWYRVTRWAVLCGIQKQECTESSAKSDRTVTKLPNSTNSTMPSNTVDSFGGQRVDTVQCTFLLSSLDHCKATEEGTIP